MSSTDSSRTVVPNLLPCSIPPGTSTVNSQLWNPSFTKESSSFSSPDSLPPVTTAASESHKQVTAYFRGRRLIGREIELPAGCRGFIADQAKLADARKVKKSAVPASDDAEPELIDLEDDGDVTDEVQVQLPRVGPKYNFSAIRVLDHDKKPVESTPALKALSEWAGLARSIHGP